MMDPQSNFSDSYVEQLKRYVEVLEGELRETNAGLVAMALERDQVNQRYREIFENSLEGIYQVDHDGRFVLANPAFVSMLGFSGLDELRQHYKHAGHLYSEYTNYDSLLMNLEQNEEIPEFESQVRHKSGSIIWLRESIRAVRNHEGKVVGYESMAIDFTRRKFTQERLRLISKVFDHSVEGIIITDANQNILEVNQAFCETTGYSIPESIGQNTRVLNSGWHDDRFYQNLWGQVNAVGLWQGEITDRRKNGEIYEQWLTICAIKNMDGEVTNYIGIFTDITEKKVSEQRIHQLAYFDVLTGLPNRSLFHDRLDHAISKSNRNSRALGVMFIDLDNFKYVNDAYGHQVGDRYLQAMGNVLKKNVRDEDTVARWGGDEFVLAIENIRDVQDMGKLAKEVISELSQSVSVDGIELFGGASIGISIYPNDGEDVRTLIKNADTAMYDAKEVGKNGYRFFSEYMNVRAYQRVCLENELHQALDRGEFVLHYQPVVSLESGMIKGAEALIRWNHPEKGLVSPQHFIPHAERSSLIESVGEWVIRSVCRKKAEWLSKGYSEGRIAINLSARQLSHKKIVPCIAEVLEETGVPPECIEFELTESAVMANPDEAISLLHDLKGLGVSLALDDFGTGYSSLSYLKRLPIDKVKIDQSFVRDIESNLEDQMIIKAIIALSHNMGLKVLAEGVESQRELEFLREQGCDDAQGYYFHKPLAAETFSELVCA